MNEEAIALKACPFGCIDKEVGTETAHPGGGPYYGICLCCLCKGPSEDTREEAVEAWNNRPPNTDAVERVRQCEWPEGAKFTFLDEPGEHDPCYIVMPGGCALPVNHDCRPGVDIARAKFIIAACNAALALINARGGEEQVWRGKLVYPAPASPSPASEELVERLIAKHLDPLERTTSEHFGCVTAGNARHAIRQILASLTQPDAQRIRAEDEGPLVKFFRDEGFFPFGHTGDYEGWEPEQTAIHFLKELKLLQAGAKEHDQRIRAEALLEEVDNEFGCSLELLERNGPSLTCAEGEFIHSSVLLDRAELLGRIRSLIQKGEE